MRTFVRRKYVKRLPDYERGVITDLFIGEASFTHDGREPIIALRMHVRHRQLLEWVRELFPRSRLYGPYVHDGRHAMFWIARGRCLVEDVMPQLRGVERLCPHVADRMERMQHMYPSRFWRER
jgi:hypothetical protein